MRLTSILFLLGAALLHADNIPGEEGQLEKRDWFDDRNEEDMTNAERFSLGLPPKKPKMNKWKQRPVALPPQSYQCNDAKQGFAVCCRTMTLSGKTGMGCSSDGTSSMFVTDCPRGQYTALCCNAPEFFSSTALEDGCSIASPPS